MAERGAHASTPHETLIYLIDRISVIYLSSYAAVKILVAHPALASMVVAQSSMHSGGRPSPLIFAADYDSFRSLCVDLLGVDLSESRRPPDQLTNSCQNIEAQACGNDFITDELCTLKHDRSLLWIRWISLSEFNYILKRNANTTISSPNPVIFRILAADIEAFKLSGNQLCDRENNANALANNFCALLVYWDRDLSCRFTSQRYSVGQCKQIGGYSDVPPINPDVDGLLGEYEPFIQAAFQGREIDISQYLIRRDGRLGKILVQFMPHRVQGEVLGVSVLLTDIANTRESLQNP